MDEKEIKKMPIKHNISLDNVDSTNGIETSSLIMYDSLSGVKKTMDLLKGIILILGLTNVATVGGFIYKNIKNPYVPYVVRISETGSINGQTLTSGRVEIDNNVMQYFLVDFVKKTRTITKNIADYEKQTAEKLSFLTETSKSKVETLFKEVTDTKDLLSNKFTTEVAIESFLPVPGTNNQFQITYSEIVFNTVGAKVKRQNYTMLVTTGQTEVKNLTMIQRNPLGIVITDVSLTLNNTQNYEQIVNPTQPQQGQVMQPQQGQVAQPQPQPQPQPQQGQVVQPQPQPQQPPVIQ